MEQHVDATLKITCIERTHSEDRIDARAIAWTSQGSSLAGALIQSDTTASARAIERPANAIPRRRLNAEATNARTIPATPHPMVQTGNTPRPVDPSTPAMATA